MPDTVATLPEFIAALKAAPDLALVFRADNTDIRTGYHVTEAETCDGEFDRLRRQS